MSLFDDVLGDSSSFTEKPFGPQEGVAGVLLGASACDGHIADEEVQSLMTILGRMNLYSRLSGQHFGNMMDRLMGTLKKGGPEKLLEKAIPAVPPELRETVFANACDIVLADGVVDSEEKEFIDQLVRRLEIDGDRAKNIVKVMVYKNKG
ncbi:Tellurite resistance protein TerB [Thalassoglobus neptunius]|uniref:Tellurite resistance protein TerB n=1 Tax=Thalassoglobus neptunius TaxID=1938619 RepID=A0A5C5X3T4_9PLAN|nr:tellurite resistance TerB family protein [Thalassoglobus neptunius]TWT56792.1 Tellurite resistance protein TerB [Thalassoglobus neptunius]